MNGITGTSLYEPIYTNALWIPCKENTTISPMSLCFLPNKQSVSLLLLIREIILFSSILDMLLFSTPRYFLTWLFVSTAAFSCSDFIYLALFCTCDKYLFISPFAYSVYLVSFFFCPLNSFQTLLLFFCFPQSSYCAFILCSTDTILSICHHFHVFF